jgi:2-phospho-L-lactate guanylyltransferase
MTDRASGGPAARDHVPPGRHGSTWALVPLRGLEAAKSRLGAELDAEERLDLVTGLLERTLEAAGSCRRVDHVLLVSPDPATLELGRRIGVETLHEPGHGLNAALEAGRGHALAGGAGTLIVLPADLPRVSPEAIAHLLSATDPARRAGRSVVALVPDRHGDGTNALVLSPPDAIPFLFGQGSRAMHEAAALAAGAAYLELEGELTLDVDTPDDLLLAEVALSPAEHTAADHHGAPLRHA